jgi:hypothetical protein
MLEGLDYWLLELLFGRMMRKKSSILIGFWE